MKNDREVYQALVDGETLVNDIHGEKIHLNDKGELSSSQVRLVRVNVDNPERWSIYKEPEWYEDIPDGGVLFWRGFRVCNIGSGEKFTEAEINAIKLGGIKILTKREVQVFMDNAP